MNVGFKYSVIGHDACMKNRIKQWWDGEKVVEHREHYAPYVVEERPWVRKLYERTPAWVLVALGAGALKQVGEELVKWFKALW